METDINTPFKGEEERSTDDKTKIGGTAIKTVVIPYDGTESQNFTVVIPRSNRFMSELPA